jgi:hypothetical protein
MKVAIMQPYLFPYIGYWQLIHKVDTFVLFDDVNFIKKGYINRNEMIVGGASQRFTLELIGASQNKLINQIEIGSNGSKILKTIEMSYKKAPYFDNVFPIIESVFNQDEKNLAKFVGHSLKVLSGFLGINTKFIFSSDMQKNNSLKGQDKILDIATNIKAKDYINSIGGLDLYDKDTFKENNINLRFLTSSVTEYKQFNKEFISHLSIIDVAMFNSVGDIKKMLDKIEIV